MKTYSITKIRILQAGKLLGVFYGFLSIILLPIFLIASRGDFSILKTYLFMLLLYPALGFVGGLAGAFIYNLSCRLVGGLKFSVEVSGE